MVAVGLLMAESIQADTPVILPKGTKAGLFMSYGELKNINYKDNVCLTSDGKGGWTTDARLTWKDKENWADFYCYAPYVANADNPRVMFFSVKTDQTTAEAQAASDFFYGRTNGNPQNSGFPKLSMRHLLSKIVVKVVAGAGFTESELKSGGLSVRVKNVYTEARIDLKEGRLSPSGSSAAIKALAEDDLTFSAIIVPQEVYNLAVIWNNREYVLALNRNCGSGWTYTLTATLKKSSGGIDISIGDWEDSGVDFGGTVN